MNNKRRLIRLAVEDFLEIKPSSETNTLYRTKVRDITPMGVCFFSEVEWRRGQVLIIDYFLPHEMDSVNFKLSVIWSEFIDEEKGYFCGGEIIEIDENKQDMFIRYYFQKLKEHGRE